MAICADHAEVSEPVGMIRQPGCARFLEPGVEDMTMAGLDHSRTDGQAQF